MATYPRSSLLGTCNLLGLWHSMATSFTFVCFVQLKVLFKMELTLTIKKWTKNHDTPYGKKTWKTTYFVSIFRFRPHRGPFVVCLLTDFPVLIGHRRIRGFVRHLWRPRAEKPNRRLTHGTGNPSQGRLPVEPQASVNCRQHPNSLNSSKFYTRQRTDF